MIQFNWTARAHAPASLRHPRLQHPHTPSRASSLPRQSIASIVIAALLVAPASALFAQTIVAGTPAGQFGVSSGGAATYSIPVGVVPGVAGMEPKLSLSYNSQAGSGGGLMGMAWNLSGLSTITRCARTVAQDGVRGMVSFNDDDRYCLDGQRLMLVSGTYGQPNAQYRSEMDNFTKVVSYGRAGNGASYFKVWTKGGQVLEYGNTSDSRIEAIYAPGTTPSWPDTTVRVWALNKRSDAKSNYLTVSYNKDAVNGTYSPNRIDYSGNATAGTAPQSSVRFSYTPLANPVPKYQAGSITELNTTLSEITTYLGASTVVNKVKLSYQAAGPTQTPRLASVQTCAANNECLSPLTMGYSEISSGFDSATRWANGGTSVVSKSDATYGTTISVMDMNGDGLPDLVKSCYNTTWLDCSNTADFAVGFNATKPSHHLTQVSSAVGVSTSIAYGKLSDPGLYTVDSGANKAVFPLVDLMRSAPVVSSVSVSNGLGGVNTTTYTYGGLKSSAGTGRGLLGFRWIKTKDTTTGIEQYSEYRQDFPYVGMLKLSETRLSGAGNAGVLKRSTITPACHVAATGAACTVAPGTLYYPYVATSLEESWDLNGAAFPSLTNSVQYSTFPHYGDPSQTSISSSDGSSVSTAMTYWSPDTNNWIVGRVKSTAVTSTKP